MISGISRSNESVAIIKLLYACDILSRPLRLIFNIVKLIVLGIIKLLVHLWNSFYLLIYENRVYLRKILIKLVAIIELILLTIHLILYFGFGTYNQEIISTMIGLIVGGLVLLALLYIYHLVYGQKALIKEFVRLTDYYIEECIANIIKIFGPPRIGKDTTMTAIASIKVRYNKRRIRHILSEIRKKCYMFNFEKVNNACYAYSKLFSTASREKRRHNFMYLASSDTFKAFLKEHYLATINYQEFIRDYYRALNNKVDYESEWLFNNGIEKHHYLDMLNDYMYMFVRLYVLKNFSMMNQPYIEDPETGLMAKQYSIYYEALASRPAKNKTETDNFGNRTYVKYIEKVENPILDWTVIGITEEDTWLNNLDAEVNEILKTYKIRDWKGFYGHFYNFLCYIQVCHDSQRMNKQLRELDAYYMNILQRVEIPGGTKRNFFLGLIQKVTDYFATAGLAKVDTSNNNIIYTRQKKIDYYNRLYAASGNDKYLAKADKLMKLDMKEASVFNELMARWNNKLMAKIEQNQRKTGVIRITAIVSDQAVPVNLKETTLKQLINRNKPLYHESFKVDFYFRMTDSMGRYNHQYMAPIMENRVEASTLDFSDVKQWPKRMTLTKEIMLNMGYPAGFKLYGITPEEIESNRYVRA